MARTIDNLGLDISTRYAQDKELTDETYIKGVRSVLNQAQIDVTTPSYTSEFEHLFGLGLSNAPWADFFAPVGFFEQKKRLFSQRLIPQLGTPDKTEAELQRVLSMGKQVTRKEEEGQQEKEDQQAAEAELELSDDEKERKILVTLLKQLQTLDQYLIDINSRRSQYQKG